MAAYSRLHFSRGPNAWPENVGELSKNCMPQGLWSNMMAMAGFGA
jgi:hypothetical protein